MVTLFPFIETVDDGNRLVPPQPVILTAATKGFCGCSSASNHQTVTFTMLRSERSFSEQLSFVSSCFMEVLVVFCPSRRPGPRSEVSLLL